MSVAGAFRERASRTFQAFSPCLAESPFGAWINSLAVLWLSIATVVVSSLLVGGGTLLLHGPLGLLCVAIFAVACFITLLYGAATARTHGQPGPVVSAASCAGVLLGLSWAVIECGILVWWVVAGFPNGLSGYLAPALGYLFFGSWISAGLAVGGMVVLITLIAVGWIGGWLVLKTR